MRDYDPTEFGTNPGPSLRRRGHSLEQVGSTPYEKLVWTHPQRHEKIIFRDVGSEAGEMFFFLFFSRDVGSDVGDFFS